ncbi:MAG: hypothetical protein CL489_06070 [Acidobacteria bacterium]|nr:hypothetical protein [Acidobacteriota bacterium]|tara:strand:+ start:5858 stop:6235 length:378 start_codon:yes stop_codon:yes gene_type:complete
MNIWLLMQESTAPGMPAWVGFVTGTGGGLVMAIFGLIALWKRMIFKETQYEKRLETKDKEVNQIGREFVELSIKMLERDEKNRENDKAIRDGFDRLIEHVKTDSLKMENWRKEVDRILAQLVPRK